VGRRGAVRAGVLTLLRALLAAVCAVAGGEAAFCAWAFRNRRECATLGEDKSFREEETVESTPPRTVSRHDELAMRFDADPDAVEWAREKVKRLIERVERFERHANEAGTLEVGARWHLAAAFMRQTMVGEDGPVVAAFDRRLPSWTTSFRREEKP
jgi:hypothetical protein